MTENGHQKPVTKAMRGASLAPPRHLDSRMERISEASENGFMSRSSSEAESEMAKWQAKQRSEVRRNSSGISSSSPYSKFAATDYQSVYSREMEEKRKSRDSQIYKTTF